MSAAARATIAVVAITAFAGAFALALDWLIGVATFHGPGVMVTELTIAAVVPLWAYAVRHVVRAAIRTETREPSLR